MGEQTQTRYGFIGLGLIGGSIAKALHKAGDAHITAYDADASVTDYALKTGLIRHAADSIGADFGACDIVFLSAPASHNLFNLRMVLPFLAKDAILTDVTSVKKPLHRLAEELKCAHLFVGGHPMTGKENGGIRNASSSLLKGIRYLLTVSPGTDRTRLQRMQEVVRKTGAVPEVLDASTHDRAVAAVSHLPHVASAALVNLVREQDDAQHTMMRIAAGGFKDITRISSSSSVLWRQICQMNQAELSAFLTDYIEKLRAFRRALDAADADAIADFFERARQYRESFPDMTDNEAKGNDP